MKMFDFSKEAYFDNHTHLLFTDKLTVTPDEFAFTTITVYPTAKMNWEDPL